MPSSDQPARVFFCFVFFVYSFFIRVGEINTLRGNKNWMRAREGVMSSDYFGADLQKLFPIIEEGGSDSSAFDNVLELLVVNGVLSLPEAIMMMLPEAWQSNSNMESEKKAWYEWAACLMEAYDGPGMNEDRTDSCSVPLLTKLVANTHRKHFPF